jgi:hypothetical protein
MNLSQFFLPKEVRASYATNITLRFRCAPLAHVLLTDARNPHCLARRELVSGPKWLRVKGWLWLWLWEQLYQAMFEEGHKFRRDSCLSHPVT